MELKYRYTHHAERAALNAALDFVYETTRADEATWNTVTPENQWVRLVPVSTEKPIKYGCQYDFIGWNDAEVYRREVPTGIFYLTDDQINFVPSFATRETQCWMRRLGTKCANLKEIQDALALVPWTTYEDWYVTGDDAEDLDD